MNTKRLNQTGMVSIMVTLIMMLVITLIVIGFSQVARRNQRESLDRQLSAQAFYAAESGVNATTASIKDRLAANPADATGLPVKQSCPNDYNPDPSSGGVGAGVAQLSGGVYYTCVLVNPHPSSLVYDDVTPDGSVVAPMNVKSSTLAKVTFSWQKDELGAVTNSCPDSTKASTYFPPLASWNCSYGVLRADLVSIPATTSLNNGSFDSKTLTVFMNPYGSATTSVPTSTSYGSVYAVSADCGSDNRCKVTIPLPTGAGASSLYYARLTSMYHHARGVTITGVLGSGGAANFYGSQAIVDVTGKAQDELKRIQVRLALTPTASQDNIPSSALSSNADICKQYSIIPGDTLHSSSTGGTPWTCGG